MRFIVYNYRCGHSHTGRSDQSRAESNRTQVYDNASQQNALLKVDKIYQTDLLQKANNCYYSAYLSHIKVLF